MFLSAIKAEDRSPWGNFWFEPVGVRTSAGMRVTADTALCLSAVYRAISLVSGHMALLPIVFYQRGTRTRIQHPVLRLLNRRPNPWQNAFEWREMLQGHLELRGNAFNEIVDDGRGQITQLVPRHPDLVRIEVLPDGEVRYRISLPDGTERTVPRGRIWHLRGLSSDGIVGLSVLEHARESFGLGLAAQTYGAKFFANDAKPSGGWIEYPGSYKDKTQRDTIREGLQESQAGMNRGKLMLLDHGMKYHEVGLTNEDAQFLETRKFSVDDIARWFGVPPHKIGSLERSTNNNIEQQALEYITDGLLTRAARWEAAIGEDLLFDDEEIDIEFNFSALLRADSTARSNYIKTMVVNGIFTRNEGREIEGKDPLPGLDKPLLPLNMVEESDADAARTIPAKGDDAAALAGVRQGNAARLARRMAKQAVPADILAEGMGVALDTARTWLDTVFAGNDWTEADLVAALLRLTEA